MTTLNCVDRCLRFTAWALTFALLWCPSGVIAAEPAPQAAKLKEGIRQFAQQRHRAMTFEEFAKYMEEHKDDLPKTPEQLTALGADLLATLDETRGEASISINDLIDMYKFRREAIRSIQVHVIRVRRVDIAAAEGLYNTQFPLYREEIDFAAKGRKLFRQERTGGSKEPAIEPLLQPVHARAYDGTNEFYRTGTSGGVNSKYNRDFFLQDAWPTVAGLLGFGMDEVPFYSNIARTFGAVRGIAYVDPERKDISGTMAVAVHYGFPAIATFYLDPKRDYVPLLIEMTTHRNDVAVKRTIEFGGYVSSRDGVRMATSVVEKRMRPDGKGGWKNFYAEEARADRLKINEPIDDRLFGGEGVFQNGTTITDARLKTVYVYNGASLDLWQSDTTGDVRSSEAGATTRPK